MADSSERREESVQVSLRELMELEEERLARERAERAAAAAEVERLRAQAEEEVRARAEEAQRRLASEERERRLDDARREALVKFSVEQARIEVEARVRAEEVERQRRHERERDALTPRTASTPWLRTLAGFGVGALFGAVIAVAVVVGRVLPEHERELRTARDAVATLEARVTDLGIARDQAARDAVDWRARAEEAQRALAARSAASREGTPLPRSGERPRTVHRPPTGPSPTSRGATCLAGDPMCFTVDGR